MEISKRSKAEIRSFIREKRKGISPEEEKLQNDGIFKKLSVKEELLTASCVYCYMDMNHEAGTGRIMEFLQERGIKTAVPRVEGDQIHFYFVRSPEELEKGCMGIMEPGPDCEPAADIHAPVIVPGVAFDRENNRLGYGGGYYDRFFEREPDHYKIGICFDFQMFDIIPAEAFDRKMDEVVTP
ncbi:5-formyltetrahydrofolate cyclo-ligase [Clostridium sp. MCC353]|uniref:5-formyltetrahydrofolate cyclo-ligase n=1 Tax=Clostridium sp. MCC353 TaxID=2592646 RepID=UPI001C024FBA|nr:5-formyltetrahydrofolate cyclo-ligase [Clostridium sp. MCC353]MBT9779610.1 5-formyltetrahydrofolate cyclo-ligase [Clostridium sp. MCC353]